jgi:Rrf2 family iron-sulfur cluster assembly transcriptional regulator
MSVLSRKALLALEAVIDVAQHARPDPVQARDITERQKVPQRYLEQIMQALVRADILRGVRGPRGGYRLARERRRITAGEIVTVINALEQQEEKPSVRSHLGQITLTPLCDRLVDMVQAELATITIEDLCRDAPLAASHNDDFTI